jgi:predicted dehydrogenase
MIDPKVYLNGELVAIDGHGGVVENLSAEWAEFAKGAGGNYATIEDAVKNHRVLDAIARSGKEGGVVNL